MKRFLSLTIVFFLYTTYSYGQFNSSFQSFLDDSLRLFIEEAKTVGISVSVRSKDHVWNRAFGISSEDDSLTVASTFAMGSVTKTITSAGILKLMEENKLSLSDPIHKYLPHFEHIDSTITIKELLNHTSGVFNYTEHPDHFDSVLSDSNQWYIYSPEEVLEQFVSEPIFKRGTAQEYSNTNYTLLGMIISAVEARPFYESLFDMFNTAQQYPTMSYPPLTSDISELANLWYDIGNGTENISSQGFGLDGLFSSVGASGAFACTPNDLSQWGYDLYSGALLSGPSMDSLFDYFPDADLGYGLGVFDYKLDCEQNAVGHGGNIFYEAQLTYSPAHDLAVAIMTNDELSLIEFGRSRQVAEEILCAYEASLVTSSTNTAAQQAVEIYPNPVQDMIYIHLPTTFHTSVQVEIYNEMGTAIYSTKHKHYDHKLQLDVLAQQQAGLYFIKVFDAENNYSKKLIKI